MQEFDQAGTSPAVFRVPGMEPSHRNQVERLLADADDQHRALLVALPVEIAAFLPVDAQGITRVIDHIAEAIGFTEDQRKALVRPHAVNPAVLHAQVFGATGLSADTVVGAYVEGARVRAETLGELADMVGGEALGAEVRRILADHPPPAGAHEPDVIASLRGAYQAQERAGLLIAAALD